VNLAVALVRLLDGLAPGVDLAVRLLVASAFFGSGLTRAASWDATLALYGAGPAWLPELEPLLATGIELVFPLLLVLGLGSRFCALVLLAFTLAAALACPELSDLGHGEHRSAALLLLVTLLHGPGALSLDDLIRRHLFFHRGLPPAAGAR
jgi:putative oxidoreductase